MKKLFFILMIFSHFFIYGKDIRISFASLPIMSERMGKGLHFELIKEMNKYYNDGKIIVTGIFPFERSLFNALKGRADAHLPILEDKNFSEQELGFKHSTTKIYRIIFNIYSNKNKPDIDLNHLNQYKLTTDIAHTRFFNFPILGLPNIETALRLIEKNRIDGWIFESNVTEKTIRNFGFKNIKKQFYAKFDVVFVFPLTKKGEETNKILSGILDKMHEDGVLENLFKDFHNQKIFQ